MTGTERMQCAFEHTEGDRVPVYEQGVARDVASAILGRNTLTGLTGLHKLEADAHLNGPAAAEDFYEQCLQDCVELAKTLQLDAVSLPWFIRSAPAKKLDELTYMWGDADSGSYVIRRYNPANDTFGDAESSSSHWEIEDLEHHVQEIYEAHPNRPPLTPEMFGLEARIQELAGDMAVVVGHGAAIPLDEIWLEAVALCPEVVEKYLDVAFEQSLDFLKVMAQMDIKFIWGGGDMASNHGPVYSPAFFRRYMLPRWKKITRLCRNLGIYYVFRTDGNLWSLADEIFNQAGFDGYGEIDVDAGMHMRQLKEEYGHLTFWGNVSCGKVLRLGSAADVVEATKKLIDDGAAGGGLVVGSSNTILHGTPAENFVAMVETAQSYGRY